jgi:putative ABC transport system permease protein
MITPTTKRPPKWADRFLAWYCRPDLLEEIQGDAYELFNRTAKKSKQKADLLFVWNVFRFFKWKNIKRSKKNYESNFSSAMLINILKVSLRNFVRQPGQSALNVFGLSAGFTCSFLILLWVAHEFSFDQFHHDGENIYKVITHVESDGGIQTYNTASCAMDVSSIPEVEKLVSISTGTRWPHELCFRPEGKPNECIYLSGVFANENLFSVFNYPILQGDPNPLKGAANLAISEKMAGLLYGTSNPIGKNIKIDGAYEVTIASIFKNVPVNSSIQFDFALPYAILKKEWGTSEEGFNQNFFDIYVNTNTPVSAALLTSKLNDIRVLTEALKNQKISYEAYPLTDWHLKSKFEGGKNAGGRIEYVKLFLIIGVLVVLMAVINFVNMSTARATLRAKEIGIRKVTGALRSTIAAQFMSESFLIVFFAFSLSLIATQLLLPFFNKLLTEPIHFTILSGNIPFYLGGFLIVVALLAGTYPSLVISSFQPVRILKNQLSSQAAGSNYFRKALLVAQLSVSIGIVIFSGVLYHQLKFIGEKDLGFDHRSVIHVEPTYKVLKSFDVFKTELLKDAAIANAALSNSNPINSGGSNTGVSWKGKSPDSRIAFKTIGCIYDFPETVGLKIMDGRSFQVESQDSVRTEALITYEAAKIMGFTNPIGEEIKMGDMTCVVIGIVNDFHTESLHESRLPAILYRTSTVHNGFMFVRYQPGKVKQAMEILSKVYSSFEPTYTMRYDFQDENYDKLYKTEKIASQLIIVFTLIALIIAVIGIVGLATFNTLRRTKEISIRRVFGASAVQALSLLTREFSFVIILAVLIAVPLAWYSADHWLQGFAYHTAMPWWIFGITCVGVLALIVFIIWLQGMKTISTNPSKTLRSE